MGLLDRWRRKGTGARAGLTETYIAGLHALGGNAPLGTRSAAVETAAGIWGRTLAGARVEGSDLAREVLTPEHLAHIGRELVREGEVVFAIRGREVLPARISEVKEGRRYLLEYHRPPGNTVHAEYGPDMVAHFRWMIDPERHWRGLGPYSRPVDAVQLAANIEQGLREEASSPRALILPLPAGEHASTELAADIAAAKGGAIMAESTAAGWDAGRQAGTLADWKAQRLGPSPIAEETALHRQAFDHLLAVAGVPPSLGAPGQVDGTRLREDWRRFALGAVAPVARAIERELSRIGADCRLRLEALHAHDIQGRATALKTLTEAGVPLAEARMLTGLG